MDRAERREDETYVYANEKFCYQFAESWTGAPSNDRVVGGDDDTRLGNSDASYVPTTEIGYGFWIHVCLTGTLRLTKHENSTVNVYGDTVGTAAVNATNATIGWSEKFN